MMGQKEFMPKWVLVLDEFCVWYDEGASSLLVYTMYVKLKGLVTDPCRLR